MSATQSLTFEDLESSSYGTAAVTQRKSITGSVMITNDALQPAEGFESGRSLAEARTHDAAPISALPLVGRKGVAAFVSPRITAWT